MGISIILDFFGGVIKNWIEKQILHAPESQALTIAASINPPITIEQYRQVEAAQANLLLKDI